MSESRMGDRARCGAGVGGRGMLASRGALVGAWASSVCALVVAGSANAQTILVGSWSDSSVKMIDATPGVFNGFLGDFVPSGAGGLGTPDGLAWGADRNLYVSSDVSGQVLRYHGRTGEFVGAFVTGLNKPGNLQFGPDGLLYVCEKATGRVLRFDPETGALIDVFIQHQALVQPVGLAWREGVLFVSDFSANPRVLRFSAETGAFLGVLAAAPGGPLILRVGPDDNIWVSAHETDDVSVIDPVTGSVLRRITQAPINCPVGHVVASDGTTVVASWLNHRLLRYDTDTGSLIETIALDVGRLRLPNDLLWTIEQCPADLTGSTDPNGREFGVPNGAIDSDDFFYYLDRFAISDEEADLDGDGDTDAEDFFAYLDFFSAGC